MRTSIATKLMASAMMCCAVACDAQPSTSPAARSGGASRAGTPRASTASLAAFGAAPNGAAANTTIVLVHGAFAGALSWQDVIPLLQREGYRVIAVENPLVSANQDVETTRRAIRAETDAGRDVVAVGHSYGGFVITGAAAGIPKVKALVYLAAFAPDANERVDAFLQQYPTALGTALVPDAAGFLRIDAAKFHDVFANDLPESQARVAAAAQKPIVGSAFGATVPVAAWKTIPSWYIVSQQDHAISPELERKYAKRMNARTTELNASHVAFISRPRDVARVILEAAAR